MKQTLILKFSSKFYLYVIFMLNILMVFNVLYNGFIFISLLFFFCLIIILQLNNLFKISSLNIYELKHKKFIFLNLFLFILNFINNIFNFLRYIFYDVVKYVREYFRNFFFNYFNLTFVDKLDFYLDNIVAVISWDVVWVTLCLIIYIYVDYIYLYFFDWSKENILVTDLSLQKKLFWCFRNDFLRYLSIFFSIYIRFFIFVAIFSKIFNEVFLFFLVFIFFISFFGSIVFWLQFTIQWYRYLLKNEKKIW